MKQYLQIIKGTWQEILEYRLNFLMWRFRFVLQRLVIYFLWWALFAQRSEIFGYSEASALTYILLGGIIVTFVTGTRTMEVGNLIYTGGIAHYLVRPLSLFRVFAARDIADKLLNLVCGIIEVIILVLLLHPPMMLQTDLFILASTLLSVAIGTVIYFFFSLLLGLYAFWYPEVWAPRFLSFVIMEFFTGALFPLDILPGFVGALARLLPFSYFLYFPVKLYLGQIPADGLLQGFSVGLFWMIALYWLTKIVWRKGLRVYTAEGK